MNELLPLGELFILLDLSGQAIIINMVLMHWLLLCTGACTVLDPIQIEIVLLFLPGEVTRVRVFTVTLSEHIQMFLEALKRYIGKIGHIENKYNFIMNIVYFF